MRNCRSRSCAPDPARNRLPSRKEVIKRIDAAIRRHRVDHGKGFRLRDYDPGDTGRMGSEDKPEAKEMLARGVEWLGEQQDKLYAQDRRSLLLVFQAMDAAGKDGTIKHVMSGVNPQGVQVVSFKQPSARDLDHDFLWRYWRELPERGRIGIFNRSYYEEVLVVRVHRAILEAQKLPPVCTPKKVFEQRLADIAHFEDYLTRQGTKVLKFFLNVSHDEQKRRFMERPNEPSRNWKFSSADVRERGHWDEYQNAYEQAIRATATPHAPWYVVPADNEWYLRLVVVAAVVQALEEMDLTYPRVGEDKQIELEAARTLLEQER